VQSAAPLPPAQEKFVQAVRAALSAHGDSNPISNAHLAGLAVKVCSLRRSGDAQSAITAGIASDDVKAKLDMTARKFVRIAEKDVCPSEIPVRQTVTYVVTGTSGAQVTYGPAGSNLTGSVPMHITSRLGTPAYYAINAQLQGSGQLSCKILVDRVVISSGTAGGGYQIADCEISQDPFTGQWQDDNG
jgi:hypothetical protein